jgi:hypothetical protein
MERVNMKGKERKEERSTGSREFKIEREREREREKEKEQVSQTDGHVTKESIMLFIPEG